MTAKKQRRGTRCTPTVANWQKKNALGALGVLVAERCSQQLEIDHWHFALEHGSYESLAHPTAHMISQREKQPQNHPPKMPPLY